MVVTAAPAAAADAPAPSIDPGQLDAMQRDLGLTRVGAVELVEAERQALRTGKELRAALGEDFGGAVFDAGARRLAVGVTDAAAADTVRAAGAEARVVTHGEGALDRAVDRLNGTVGDGYPGVTGWYPDLGRDALVVTVREGRTADAEQAVAAAGIDPGMVVVEASDATPRTFADIVGGDPYFINDARRCSIGFGVRGGFVTAGHCGNVGDTAASSVPAFLADSTGTFEGSMFPGKDMAFVGDTVDWRPTSRVRYHAQRVAGSQEAAVNSSVCRSGSTTGYRCGTVQARNVTVRYVEGTVYGLTQTTVCAERGDSGGPFITGDQAQGVLSGGTGNCNVGGISYFQPVNEILDTWNLQLVTG
nr:S1 family peptidase [Nocardiopsis mwathae]